MVMEYILVPQRLAKSFYIDTDVLRISRDLLGKVLVSNINGAVTAGIITETEAYKAPEDKASHAYNNRRTPRTETMFCAGGIAYVYLCYGMHHLFNIVTGPQDLPHAVLIRALQPLHGIELMQSRRGHKKQVANGPATLTQALAITTQHNGTDLLGDKIWVEDHGIVVNKIIETTRVGINYAKEYAHKPWRFICAD